MAIVCERMAVSVAERPSMAMGDNRARSLGIATSISLKNSVYHTAC